MDIFIKILQFVLSFSLLVIVHEFGHFMFAKIFGVRVEVFSLFFGKQIFKWKKGDTEYGIGWIPFGGYVKLSGMIDESMDTEQMKQEPQPYEFRTKPAWQRLLIMFGGVMMNVVLAFVIYSGMSYTWGDKFISTQDMKYGYVFNDMAHQLGFRDGDKIISVGGKEIDDYDKILTTIMIESDRTTVVERDGEQVVIDIPTQSVMDYVNQPDFLTPRYPFVIGRLMEKYGADEAGIETGDRLISFNGEPMIYFDQYRAVLEKAANETVTLGVLRGADTLEMPVKVSSDGKIGVTVNTEGMITLRTREYTLLQSIPAGVKRVGTEISDYWKQLKMVVQPETEAYKSLGGPLAIGNIFPSEWSWEVFWRITALLSIVLAVMNILPIPALDGGHILFLMVEMISRRKPSDKFLIYAQTVGMSLLILLMVYATWNDIHRFFVK